MDMQQQTYRPSVHLSISLIAGVEQREKNGKRAFNEAEPKTHSAASSFILSLQLPPSRLHSLF
jgi:hypothetical protein